MCWCCSLRTGVPRHGWAIGSSDAGLTLEVRRVDLGELPESLDGFDGLLVLGGTISAFADSAVSAGGAGAATRGRPLASCRRSGSVSVRSCSRWPTAVGSSRTPDGPELGAQLVAKRTTAANDPLFREIPIAPDVIQWHWDAITTLPTGAIQLASSLTCEQQAFRLGRLAWGVQFHIETTPQIVEAWARSRRRQTGRLRPRSHRRPRRQRARRHRRGVAPLRRELRRDRAHAECGPAPQGSVPTSFAEPITDPAAIRAALAAELAASRGGSTVIPLTLRRPDA